MKLKINLPFKITKKRVSNKSLKRRVKITRSVSKITKIDKNLFLELLKTIIMNQITSTGSAIGFVFDLDSIVSSSGQLVGAQSTRLPVKGSTVVFYIECLYRQFEIDQNQDLSPTHDNLEKLNTFLKKIVADQIFAIESQPEQN